MIVSAFDRVENIVGKGEIACTSNFNLFPQSFQKASYQDASEGVIVWEWVKQNNLDFIMIMYHIFFTLSSKRPPMVKGEKTDTKHSTDAGSKLEK